MGKDIQTRHALENAEVNIAYLTNESQLSRFQLSQKGFPRLAQSSARA